MLIDVAQVCGEGRAQLMCVCLCVREGVCVWGGQHVIELKSPRARTELRAD